MTTFTTLAALLPVLTSTGRGADVARAMALPVFGGMLVELITLFVVPVVYCAYHEMRLAATSPVCDRSLQRLSFDRSEPDVTTSPAH